MNVDEGDSTIHLLCHGSSRDPMKIREYLKKFFEEHFDFLTEISSHILAWKKCLLQTTLTTYCQNVNHLTKLPFVVLPECITST